MIRTFKKSLPLIIAFMLVAGLFTACETLIPKKPEKLITIHEIVRYPRANQLEKEIQTFSGRTIWVNSNPFMHSRSIKKINLVAIDGQPDYYDLELELNRRGSLIWMQLSVGFANRPLAFVIDGVYYRSFIIREKTSEEDSIVYVRGPFDRVTANSLKDNARNNYRYFNPDETSFFSMGEEDTE